MKKGLYYIPAHDKLVYLSKVSNYEDMFSPPFAIVTYETDKKAYPKTLIRGFNMSAMVYLGPV